MASIHTIASTEDTFYQWWQIEALYKSFQWAHQPGRFTALVAERSEGDPLRLAWSVPFQRTRHYAIQHDDYYLPRNKPGSIMEILQAGLEEQTVLIIDPDCLFVRALDREVEPGRLVGQFIDYMDPTTPQAKELTSRFCRRNQDDVRPIGIPVLIHRDDLAAIAPRWLELCVVMRADERDRQLAGWVSEMWAFCFAVAEADLEVVVEKELCQTPLEDANRRPIIHYCFPMKDSQGFTWDKRDYKPWSPLPRPAPHMTASSRMTLTWLGRVAASFDHRLVEPVESILEGEIGRGLERLRGDDVRRLLHEAGIGGVDQLHCRRRRRTGGASASRGVP